MQRSLRATKQERLLGGRKGVKNDRNEKSGVNPQSRARRLTSGKKGTGPLLGKGSSSLFKGKCVGVRSWGAAGHGWEKKKRNYTWGCHERMKRKKTSCKGLRGDWHTKSLSSGEAELGGVSEDNTEKGGSSRY